MNCKVSRKEILTISKCEQQQFTYSMKSKQIVQLKISDQIYLKTIEILKGIDDGVHVKKLCL